MADLAAFTTHGGRLDAARTMFGGEDWIDLSTGIAPWAWPVEAMALGLDRLPDTTGIAALERAAAAVFGVGDPGTVVAVPGTDLALRILATVIDAQRAAVVRPGYAGHAAAWPGAQALGGGTLDDLADHDLLVVASPANPDGRITDPGLLRRLAERMTVVIDEAYADPDPGLCPCASDRVIVLRSFGKFYGLPGLRLGFVVAGPQVAAAVRHALGDWPVSSAAVAIGAAAYRAERWRDAQATRISVTGQALDDVLATNRIAIAGTAPLFRLVEVADADRLFRRLATQAILTRPFVDRPDRLRIGLPRDAASLARLSFALKEYAS